MTINYTPTTGLAGLQGYSISITDTSGVSYPDGTGTYAPQTRTFPVDTSFEPYRREAFRHKSIPAQREAIQMTNVMGEGTVNTEGLWRREQREWSMGAGQQYLDHRDGDSDMRFYASKGIDVFNYPAQATLLPDTYKVLANTASNVQVVACNGYVVMGGSSGGTVSVYYFNGNTSIGTAWTQSGLPAISFGTTYGGTAPTVMQDMAASPTYVWLATDTGIWFAQPGSGSFQLFASGSYGMVAWANDQLIASGYGSTSNLLYAFQPRSATTAPIYGSAPSVTVTTENIGQIANGFGGHGSSGTFVYMAATSTQFVIGQSVTIAGAQAQAQATSLSLSGNTLTATCTSGTYSGFQVGDTITVEMNFSGTYKTETVTVSAVGGSGNTFSWVTKSVASTTGFTNLIATATSSLFNNTWTISAISGTEITIVDNTGATLTPATYGTFAVGGNMGNNNVSDLLFSHPDPSWVWSDAVGGETQIYFAGYSSHTVSGTTTNGNGCIYRSDLLGSSTTSPSGVSTVSTSTVAQPFQLVTPVQALPMSPDEYPTAIKSYLNFIFIGTNRGIRMAQTLSVYDPTATATGDLKSGPLIPNILQPLTSPVTAIIGDGRFVWFTWNNYDATQVTAGTTSGSSVITLSTPSTNATVGQTISGNGIPTGTIISAVNGTSVTMSAIATATSSSASLVLGSTGLGKLDLSTFINQDELAPVYATDLMVSGQGTITSLAWNPSTNLPLIAVGGLGVYQPYATNVNGVITATKYVRNGSLTTSIFDYGIPDQKAPVYFEYGGSTNYGSSIQANVICEPLDSFALTLPISSFTSPTSIGTATKEYPMPTVGNVSNPKSSQFQVVMRLVAGTSINANDTSPVMYRWTLKSFPNVVSGTNISVVLQMFSVDVVDGQEVYIDPYDNFYWLESLRQAQNIVTYQEGPLSASISIIESLDWIPHKRRDNYENGYEGDIVVTLKTLGPYSYTKPST